MHAHADRCIFHIWLWTEEWNNEYMLMRTTSGIFFEMKHFQKPDIVRMGVSKWYRERSACWQVDKSTCSLSFWRGEVRHYSTTAEPWGITQLTVLSLHSDGWGLSRCLAESWQEREAERMRLLICLPFSPLRLGEAGD